MSETVVVKKWGKFLLSIALLLSIAALAASGYLYYKGIEYTKQSENKLNHLINSYTAQFKNYNEQIKQLNLQNQALHDTISRLNTNKTNIVVYQVNELISLANQSLLVYLDLKGTIRLLNYAQNVLTGNNAAIFTGLKLALSSDLDKLNQVPVIDNVMLSGELNSILLNIDKLSLTKPQKSADNPTSEPDNSKWHQFLDNIKNTLFNTITVSKSGIEVSHVLLPEENILIRQRLKTDILNARLALLEHDNVNWKFSLNDAVTNINEYFKSDGDALGISNKLFELQELNIGYSNVNIDDSLKALNKLNNLVN